MRRKTAILFYNEALVQSWLCSRAQVLKAIAIWKGSERASEKSASWRESVTEIGTGMGIWSGKVRANAPLRRLHSGDYDGGQASEIERTNALV